MGEHVNEIPCKKIKNAEMVSANAYNICFALFVTCNINNFYL